MTLRVDRLALFAAVLVLLAGYLAIYRPAEAALAERYARLDDGRARLDERLALARRAGAARTETGALDVWLRARGLADDRTTIVARFLHDLAGTAHGDGVDVTGVVAEPGGAAPPVAANAAPTVALDEIPLAPRQLSEPAARGARARSRRPGDARPDQRARQRRPQRRRFACAARDAARHAVAHPRSRTEGRACCRLGACWPRSRRCASAAPSR
jgi:hypothetical protein